jgi:predicted acylesterase/phospholipase RssA
MRIEIRRIAFAMSTKIAVIGMVLILSACSGVPERNPVPRELIAKAAIPGVPEARFWGDEWPKWSEKRLQEAGEAELQKNFPAIYRRPHSYLAISGGGAQGAFGAGLLLGWTASGTRPEFTMVTGISTGALTAPFAFLGSEYDDELKTVYTTTTTADIAKERGLISAFFSDSIADTEPLKRLIAKYITDDVITAIGREHMRGRRLFIGTVNLDAGRSVIWNIGAIAISDHPQKADLIRSVMRASAAIPVAFSPIVIPVESGGSQYDELHVDGGTGAQVFVYPAAVDWAEITKKLQVQGQPSVYVIRNAFLDPDYQGIKRNVMPIASRSISNLIRTQGVGDLYQVYGLCKRDGNDFNLAYIPSDFDEEPTEGFDPVYMTKLLDFGYELARDGYPWKKAPPDFLLKR